MFANVTTVLSLITMCTGIDAGYIIPNHAPRYVIGAWMSIWVFLVWLVLKFFHVHEKSFSREAVKKYKELGCKTWWVVAYFIASYVAMAVSASYAGRRLGLHH
jgi:hypothetical protein